MKKRILALAGAVVLALSMSMTAFATPSTQVGDSNITDANGNPVSDSVIKVVDTVSNKYDSALAGLDFNKVITGTDAAGKDWVEVGDSEVVKVGEGEVDFPITISFNKSDFAGKPLILAYIDGAWVVLNVVDGGDVWKITVNGETVLKFYEQKAASKPAGGSPQTGDPTTFVWGAVAVASAATAVVAKRKMK